VHHLQQTPEIELAVVEHTGQGFHVVKHRGKVERTCAWRLNDRRQSRDYEALTVNSEARVQISMMPLLLKRLA
jgi:transposase